MNIEGEMTLAEMENEAARLTGGFYWTMEWLAITVGCYCIAGLLGLLIIPVALEFPGAWVAMIGWYGFWFVVAPPRLRQEAAQNIINRGGRST